MQYARNPPKKIVGKIVFKKKTTIYLKTNVSKFIKIFKIK